MKNLTRLLSSLLISFSLVNTIHAQYKTFNINDMSAGSLKNGTISGNTSTPTFQNPSKSRELDINPIIFQKSDLVVNPLSEPVVLEEPNVGDFLVIDQSYTEADTRWAVNSNNILNKFFETYSDYDYDFIVLCPNKQMVSSWCMVMNRHIDGIGGYATYPNAPNLKALIQFNLIPNWMAQNQAPDSINLNRVLIHEIGHYWLSYINWLQHYEIAHWRNNLDLFSGDTRYIDPMAYYHWVIKDGKEACVDGNGNATSKFSNLSLYLMGLLPPNQVSPIYEHVFEPKPGKDSYNEWGPSCGEVHNFIETKTITIQDIINKNGARNPSYDQSKKDFRIAFVIVTAKGEVVPSGFIDHVKIYMDALPDAWYKLTSGKSTIGYVENPQIVLSKTDINFGQVIAKSVKTDTLMVTNNSITPLLIDSLYTDSKWFTVTSRKITLNKTDTLKLLVYFTADTMKTYSGVLYIKSNSSTQLTKIILKGELAIPEISFLSVTPSTQSVSSTSGTSIFTVSSNIDWSVSENCDWLTATKTNSTKLTVDYNENTRVDQRLAEIIISGTNVDSKIINLVQKPNNSPIANAGLDQSVNEGATVTLDGSASSDSDGNPLTYKWTAPVGIALSSTTDIKSTFIAPEVKKDSVFSFSLIVNDGIANSSPVFLKITVLNVIKVGNSETPAPAFKVYPNPTTGMLTLEFTQNSGKKTEVSVTNLVGAEVFQKELDTATNYEIDLSNQVSGIYLLKVIADGQQYIGKIVIRKE